jgi:hypothetical protein
MGIHVELLLSVKQSIRIDDYLDGPLRNGDATDQCASGYPGDEFIAKWYSTRFLFSPVPLNLNIYNIFHSIQTFATSFGGIHERNSSVARWPFYSRKKIISVLHTAIVPAQPFPRAMGALAVFVVGVFVMMLCVGAPFYLPKHRELAVNEVLRVSFIMAIICCYLLYVASEKSLSNSIITNTRL